MRCVITGGTGFIGSNLALHLIEQGDEIIITGHDAEQKLPPFKGRYLQPTFLGFDWDSVGKVDALFHQAAINDTTNMDRDQMLKANFESSKQLFEKMVDMGCRRIVYASSTAVYGDLPAPYKEHVPLKPLNPYAESKKALDEFAMNFAKEHPDVIIVGLRYCNVYGPREDHKGKRASMIYQLAQQMINGNPRIFKYGEQKRDYIYVKDVVTANMLAAKAKESCIV
ncbi:MAG: NAD-dependent epimerase/dehydratase family protein, partial [bacterium]